MMFGLSSLVYVRDYVQGLQSQHNQSSCAHASDEIGARNFWGFSELPESKERDQRRQNVVVDASSAKLGSFMTHEFSPRNRTSKPLGFIENNLDQNKTCFQTCDELVQNGNLLKQPYSLFDSACSGRPQENIASSERFGSLTHDHGSELPQVSSSTVQQRKVEDDWKLRNFKKRATRSTAFRAITRDQSLPQRHVSPLSPALRNGERTSGPIAQSGSKLRRLSPLRESSGNIHRSAEIEQQSIVVQKTRKAAKSVSHPSKPSDRIFHSPVRKSSLKSFLSPRSSFGEDYTNSATFLGRYRTPSSSELHFFQTSSPFYQGQPIPRTASLSSLRHLPPDQERSLYIGVNNHKLFLPPKSNRSSTPIVAYRRLQCEERKTPSMTPYAIIGPGDSDRLPTAMSLATLTCAQPASALGAAGGVRRSTSTIATAGSMDSCGSDETLVEGGKCTVPLATPATMNPVQSVMASFFDKLVREFEEHSDSDSMLQMMDSFQVTESTSNTETDNSLQIKQTGFYYEFTQDMGLRRAVSVNSKTSFSDELSEEINLRHNISGNQIQLKICKQSPCNVLTDHDEAYACWHPEVGDHRQKEQHVEHIGEIDQQSMSARELESSISAGEVRNRAQRSVSFAEGPARRASTRYRFAVYRHSTSLSDSITPSPLISPRLRGPSFSKEFEECMLTLPMPPVEHSVPFAGLRSTIALSSKKPKGFWAKLGDTFKGCFGAH